MAKFNMIAAAVATASLALAAPAFAETSAGNVSAVHAAAAGSTSAAAKTATAGEKTKYCFDTESTGTRIPRRVCLTKTQWASEGVDVEREMKR